MKVRNAIYCFKNVTKLKLFAMFSFTQGIRSSGATKYGVVEEIEKLINMAYPIEKVLRLLCLCSLMDGGIRTEDFYRIKRYILDVSMQKIDCSTLLISY